MTTETLNGQPPETSAWEVRHAAGEYRLQRVQDRAAQITPGRTAATLIAGLFIGIAWVAGRLWRLAWRGLAFTVAALQVGWSDGTGKGPSKNDLIQENADLRTELARWSGDEHAAAVIGSRRR